MSQDRDKWVKFNGEDAQVTRIRIKCINAEWQYIFRRKYKNRIPTEIIR